MNAGKFEGGKVCGAHAAMTVWNPWHGCKKISAGCQNCYVYRRDGQFGKDSSIVQKTASFCFPIQKRRNGTYRLAKEETPVYACLTSDFFLEEADEWRKDAWAMVRERKDLDFVIITKRIHRFPISLPSDWGEGYSNVTVICTCENQETADKRLPLFLSFPIRRREIIHEPMLEEIHIEPYLATGKIQAVTCGGESGEHARLCDYGWILASRRQCVDFGVQFTFKQTGARFQKNGRIYAIDRKFQISQAKKAGIDYMPVPPGNSRAWEEKAALDSLFERLSRSAFRSQFRLEQKERSYMEQQGMDVIRRHAEDFIRKRLAPADPANDGKQTPMRGHPVFIAQHATGICCRGCLQKWHGIPKGRALTNREQDYLVTVLLAWMDRQMRQE